MYNQVIGNIEIMKKWKVILLASTILAGCVKPYNPPAITSNGSYLVVEGAINSGSDPTTITLNRTVNLSSHSSLKPELHAIVAVQSDQNLVFPLTEAGNGRYVSAGLNLSNSHTYRLSIKTSNNEQYYSDYVTALNSPPIDSVNFTITNNGVNIYSNTHDATNRVKYYRWDYQETWIIHSNYDSGFISNGDTVLERTPAQQVTICWSSDTSSNIVLGSTAALARDVISGNPITSIVSTSEKLSSEYSILVRQYALTGDAYNFWVNLRNNTENLGSIFDAQPSQINGNIHSATNPTEPVIGYISVGSTSSIRIFIKNQQLPGWLAILPNYNCVLDTFYYKYIPPGGQIPVNQVNEYINYDKGAGPGALIPIAPVGPPLVPPTGYTASSTQCVECTLRGTNIQPSYWIY